MAPIPRSDASRAPPSSPGVYVDVRERAADGRHKAGVPAFIGAAPAAAFGPNPRPFHRYAQFEAAFGRDASPLARAVRGFFENGGRLCYVAPMAPSDAPSRGDALGATLDRIEALDEVDLVAAPELAFTGADGPLEAVPLDSFAALQQRLVDACDRHGGWFALLDAPRDADVDGMLRHRARLRGTNAALYAPWLVVAADRGETPVVPPCGHVAGAVAATDAAAGVFKAPANLALAGVIDVSRPLDRADQDRLNPQNVNALRAFPGRGIRVWGARTISVDPNWRYINVRRLFMAIARWIETRLASAAFEPNDARLWNRVTREVTDHLTALFNVGALEGASPAEAFFVKCDGETNPPAVRDAGMLVTEVGLASAKPCEFVVVRVTATADGVATAALG